MLQVSQALVGGLEDRKRDKLHYFEQRIRDDVNNAEGCAADKR